MKQFKWDIRKFISGLAVATVIALTIRLFIVEDYLISTDSMKPGLLAGDLVVTSKLAFNFHLPFSNFELVRFRNARVGEVVAFALPEEGMKTFVKRVVAIAGQTVEIRDGVLLVADKPMNYRAGFGAGREIEVTPGSGEQSGAEYEIQWDRAQAKQFGPVDVPKDHFFVLSDNRDVGLDSRLWGPIPGSCLKGRATFVWMSKDPEAGLRWARLFQSVH